MTTYDLTLSTTEPNNWVGLIKVRQGDTESQTFNATIVENNVPKDFTGLTPFFCVKSSPYTGLGISEQKVTDGISAKDGKLSYTLTDHDMQAIQTNHAYFSFRKIGKDGTWRQQFSTKDFAYTVTPSIYSDGICDSNYIWTFDEILRYFNEWVAESMKTYDDWYLNAQAELKRIIAEFKLCIEETTGSYSAWLEANKTEFLTWQDSIKSNFVTWQDASKNGFNDWFQQIKDQLGTDAAGSLQLQLDEVKPSFALPALRHIGSWYPECSVLYWENGLDSRGLDTIPIGGSPAKTIPYNIEYNDIDKVTIYVPAKYKLLNIQVQLISKSVIRYTGDNKTIELKFKEEVIPIAKI